MLMPAAELQIKSAGASPGICEVVLPVLVIDLPEVLGHQRLDGLADQVCAVITEQRFRLPVDEPDHALLVHAHQRIGHTFQKFLKSRCLGRHLPPSQVFTTP
jgi:hypothetical protein